MSPNVTGALLMMASMFCFTVNDAFIKATDGALPLGQLLVIRGTMAGLAFLILALALRNLRFDFSARVWGLLLLRCGAEVGAAYFFLTALLNMPFANVTAVLQALPLAVTLGAYLVFGEAFGWRRLLAILIGFAGMLLIVRPGAEGFSSWSLYALVAVVFVTARDLVTRKMPKELPSLTVAMFTSVAVTLAFATTLISTPWTPVTPDLWLLIGGSTLFIIGAYVFSIQTMRVGEVSFIAPFRYTSLLWATLLGWTVFGEWPDPLTILGAAIIVGAGLFTFYRERRVNA